ncbi:hypothetical protein [Pedobacter mendelii]|uniref:Uncharacterized protein n=1 Tax=Pedobacter mendelii TaxID=1908240 RepID=A0ABQ2BHG9_9SPHI|nr:hypothetical protein [Pedobacter mendelii]GGI24232.1 hypothetical protein GCM10008119_11630 [Pedobacter mendelii]
MKKNKSKSKKHSTSKKIRKELELKLADSFNEIVKSVGKSKKADKVIERFAKQLSKKITISDKSDSITPFIKEEVVPTKKEVIKKAKAPVKELVE